MKTIKRDIHEIEDLELVGRSGRMITVNKNQSKLIPIFLDNSKTRSSWSGNLPAGRQGDHDRISSKKDSIASLQNDKVRNRRIDVVLAGENARVEIVSLVLGNGDENKSLELYVTHAAPQTKSEVKVKSVLKDRSTFAFRGNVKIEKGAKGADAYLRSDALLFDEAKMGDDTPALEILEPDVKAGHAATIGKVDEQMLFYLMSRGLSRKQAEGMLVDGFVEPIRKLLNDKRLTTKANYSSVSL